MLAPGGCWVVARLDGVLRSDLAVKAADEQFSAAVIAQDLPGSVYAGGLIVDDRSGPRGARRAYFGLPVGPALNNSLVCSRRAFPYRNKQPPTRSGRTPAGTDPELEVRSTIYQAPRWVNEFAGRQTCIERLAQDAITHTAELIVFERDDSVVLHDRRTLHRVLLGSDGQPMVRYQHLRPYEESLLWIPDFVAWCWARGGTWRKLIQPVVEELIQL